MRPGDLVITTRHDGRDAGIAVWLENCQRPARISTGTFGVVVHDDNNFPASSFLKVVFTTGHVGTVLAAFLDIVR